jgi:hypothetical protein
MAFKNYCPTPRGPVLLLHGAGVRSNNFNHPNHKNLLDALAEAGSEIHMPSRATQIPKG